MMEGIHMHRREVIAGAAGAALLGHVACRATPVDRISLLDYLPAGQHRAIAQGCSNLDCAPMLQRALGDAVAAGTMLWVPRGTYLLAPTHALVHADPHFECRAAVRLTSGMRLAGEAGATLQMVPEYSGDRRPRAMVMFGTDEALEDVAISGLVLDMNGRRNPISPDRAERTFSRLPQAQIFVSSRSGREAARIDRARISDTVFRDANGVSCIVMAQTNDHTARLGRQWSLKRCVFRDNGMDTDDHSSVFAYAEDVSVNNCTFANAQPFATVGVNTAYEVHGSGQQIRGCTFANMLRGIWVANNYSAVTSGTVIANNDFGTLFYGVDFFHDRAEAQPIVDTRIENNRFRFNDQRIAEMPRLDFKAAVQIASEYGQQGIRVTGNSVDKTGHSITSAFLVVTGGASGARRHDDIVVSGNIGSGLTFGSFVRTTPTAGLGRLEVVRNRWHNLAPSGLMAIAAGDAVERTGTSQPVASLALGGGSVEVASGRQMRAFGVFINTTVCRLDLQPIATPGIDGSALKLGDAGRILVSAKGIR